MADDGETLLREILQNPEDDAPRLVFADWLQQRGDPDSVARGELIYAQCAVEHAETPDRPALVARIRELVKRNGRKWTSQLREAKIGSRWKFRRGFVDSGVISATRFVMSASDMFALAPTLRVFRFPEASNELVKLVECEFFARVIEADLTTMCSCGSCKIEREHPKLFASPYATNLRVLKLGDCRMTDANAKLLAESAVLANLTTLDLSQNRITGTGGEASRGHRSRRCAGCRCAATSCALGLPHSRSRASRGSRRSRRSICATTSSNPRRSRRYASASDAGCVAKPPRAGIACRRWSSARSRFWTRYSRS